MVFLLALSGSFPFKMVLVAADTSGWTRVVSSGFGDLSNVYFDAFAEFKGYIYRGVSKFTSSTPGEVWRTSDGINWEQVGTDGFGDPNNHSWRIVVFKDKLYAGAFNPNGAQIWVSSDGEKFTKIVPNGFGNPHNYDVYFALWRDMLVAGTSNSNEGAEVWITTDGNQFQKVVEHGLGDPGNTGTNYAFSKLIPAPLYSTRESTSRANSISAPVIRRAAERSGEQATAHIGRELLTTV